jgi:hypothetical protein
MKAHLATLFTKGKWALLVLWIALPASLIPTVCTAADYYPSLATSPVNLACGAYWKFCKSDPGFRKYVFPVLGLSFGEPQAFSVSGGAIFGPPSDDYAWGQSSN